MYEEQKKTGLGTLDRYFYFLQIFLLPIAVKNYHFALAHANSISILLNINKEVIFCQRKIG